MERPPCLDQRGATWNSNDLASVADYVIDLVMTEAPFTAWFTGLRGVKGIKKRREGAIQGLEYWVCRFDGAVLRLIHGDNPDRDHDSTPLDRRRAAVMHALGTLRRGFDPVVCPFEDWFSHTGIIAELDGIRPDHLDAIGSTWSDGMRQDALMYTLLSGGNLQIIRALITGVIKRRSGPQWNVRVGELIGLEKTPIEIALLARPFDEFDPAVGCFEFWLLSCLIKRIEGNRP